MFKLGRQVDMAIKIDKWLEHEKMRWEECNEDELSDRLDKIKNPLKIRSFIIMAQEYQAKRLYLVGCLKARELGYGWVIPRDDKISKLSKDGKKPEPLVRKVRT